MGLNKKHILFLSLAIFFVLVFLVWVWAVFLKKTDKIEQEKDYFSESVFKKTHGTESGATFKKEGAFKEGKREIQSFKFSFSEEKNVFKEEILDFSKTVIEPIKENSAAISADYETGALISNEELFKAAFPQYYIDYLNKMSGIMISSGYMEGIPEFNTEEDVFAFLNSFVDFLEKDGDIDAKQADLFRGGINNTLKDLISQENMLRRKGIMKSKFGIKYLAFKIKLLDLSVKNKLSRLLETKTAFAKTCIPGKTYDCAQEGGGGSSGANLWAPCCNCWVFVRNTCVPVGCLNSVCLGGNAIWDPATGICGCG